MDEMIMSQTQIETFLASIMKLYGWSLLARSGHGNQTDDTYTYIYVDDAGISITINPVNKGFSFCKSVDFLFKLKSDEFTPLDYPDHFEKNYLRFRRIVLEKQLD